MDPSSKSPDDDDLRPEAGAARRPQPQPQPREWRFAQVFGERAAGEDVQEGENVPTRPLPLLAACVAWFREICLGPGPGGAGCGRVSTRGGRAFLRGGIRIRGRGACGGVANRGDFAGDF